jgi:hypothetical protein
MLRLIIRLLTILLKLRIRPSLWRIGLLGWNGVVGFRRGRARCRASWSALVRIGICHVSYISGVVAEDRPLSSTALSAVALIAEHCKALTLVCLLILALHACNCCRSRFSNGCHIQPM